MLNAKEKALELVNKFLNVQNTEYVKHDRSEAKQCALICVNELIEIMDEEGYDEEDTEIVYLEEVKNQINLC
tara:strand:+ start:674 stop:889 length:216 start_codon:yes stop_codon:yes gene_type:complete